MDVTKSTEKRARGSLASSEVERTSFLVIKERSEKYMFIIDLPFLWYQSLQAITVRAVIFGQRSMISLNIQFCLLLLLIRKMQIREETNEATTVRT